MKNSLKKETAKVLLLGTRGGLLNTDWKLSSEIVLDSKLKIGQSWTNKKDDGETEDYKVVEFKDVTVPAGEFKNVIVLQKTVSSNRLKIKKERGVDGKQIILCAECWINQNRSIK